MAVYIGDTRLSGNVSSFEVTGKIEDHNTSKTAHKDIRDEILTNEEMTLAGLGEKKFESLTNKPTTLFEYGITDGATSAQGLKADTAIQSAKLGDVVVTKNDTGLEFPAYPTTLPASDVQDWAKETSKPAYTAIEVGAASIVQGGKADTAIQSAKIGDVEVTKTGTELEFPLYPTTLPANGGNADTATKLQTARTINGVSFDGGADIAVADDTKIIKNELGNASQVLFGDGTSFQAKLDSGELKGEDGANGAQGIQGIPGATGATGAKGADGLTTQVTVNGSTYTQVGGTISLPAYTLPVKYKTGADFTVAELAEGQLGVVY